MGQVKSGKTTLINAMAGWSDLLPSDVNPWTSVVTSLHLTPGRDKKGTSAVFQFLGEDEWDRLLNKGGRMGQLAGRAGAESELAKLKEQIELVREKSRARLGRNFELLIGQSHQYGYFDKNLLERYICLGDEFDQHENPAEVEAARENGRFADITRTADLYLSSPTIPHRICVRDTPGVNDTFLMREQITIQAIRDSRISVVVLSSGQALTSVDMGLIRLISNLKSREVIFFVNRIDELADPPNQIQEIEESIRATLAQHHGPVDADIVFGSANWANKALNGDIEKMDRRSSAVLIDWAEKRLKAGQGDQSVSNMIWELSGIPALLEAISDRVIDNFAEPFLTELSASAITLATGQHAADLVRVNGSGQASPLGREVARTTFDRLEQETFDLLNADLAQLIESYRQRVDRAHATFVDRATHSLIKHLEDWGEKTVWEYDPSGLRILLRSAYSLLSSRCESAARTHYERAVSRIAELLFQSFGTSVEGIQIRIPDAPGTPPPIALGQTIALDFNDGWWVNWWRRHRGYQAFANQFRALITSETEDFMSQIKFNQTEEIRAGITGKLEREFASFRSLFEALTENSTPEQDLQEMLCDRGELKKREKLDAIIASLREHAK
ncbi:dynamin family protein [Marimonas lutisalis]|uniref:dynamin family protein n=1 Tax=Marimonas lutisalis TaxID=2545756 RepID=UPI001F2451E9|nr:dynamin family protein [Marimonas lutisalis]